MSTDLYGIRILGTKPEENKIQVKVFVVYYDVTYKSHQPIPKDHSFFFRILWDKGDIRFGQGGPIGNEVSVDQIGNEDWVDQNTFKFIKKVKMISKSNFPVEDYSIYKDFYYEKNGEWEDENILVQADFDLEVTNKKYIDHLIPGMSWGTTSYETNALKVSLDHLKVLPDISNLLIRLEPFQDKDGEQGTIATALFSKDSSKLFILSEAGELVCFKTEKWKEEWRNETGEWYGNIKIDHTRKLVWIKDNQVYNFEGAQINEEVAPYFKSKYKKPNSILRSPSGDYFLFSEYSERIAVYDHEGNFLWEYESDNGDPLFTTFFTVEKQVMVRAEQSGIFKSFDLETGSEVNKFRMEGSITSMDIDPTGSLFSINDQSSNSTKIIEINSLCSIFELSTKYKNNDYLSAFIWSPNNDFVAIKTVGNGTRSNQGYGGNLSIYPVGIKSL